MNYIWAGIIMFAFISAVFTKNMGALSTGIIGSGAAAVTLLLKLLGMLCLWGGLMNIAEKSGLTDKVRLMLSPVLRLLFPGSSKDSPAMRAVSMNITANLLGLGNAATPFGMEAMKRLKGENHGSLAPSNNMALFVVLNTAALRIVPTTAAVLREAAGAAKPMDILPAVWLSSFCSLAVGIVTAKILEKNL